MLIRFLALVLIFSACSGAATTTDTSELEESQKKPSLIFKTPADVTDRVETILSGTPYPLQEEQKTAIDKLTATYTFEYLNESRGHQSELRKKILEQVMTPEQEQAWKNRGNKPKKSITIE
jgi:ABC-type glycerol-3-phosphate transport system substrate-binding protein